MSPTDKPVSFLFMDERHPDNHLPKSLRSTTLTGLLVPAVQHRELRDRFYPLVTAALSDEPGKISMMPAIHAADLFPGKDDDARFKFLEGLVEVVRSMELRLFRIGYTEESVRAAFGTSKATMGLLFNSMLFILADALNEAMVWPVMEIDRTEGQDAAFAGSIQGLDYFVARTGPSSVSIDNRNLGEVLYTTKRSASGAIVDCLAYLLHALTLRDADVELSPFKARLASIADGVRDCIAFNEIISLRTEGPPAGYKSDGPIRYAVPITPTD